MLAVTGVLRFRAEDRDRVRNALNDIIVQSRADAGCVDYWFAESLTEPGAFHFFECWESEATFDAHVATPAQATFGQEILSGMIGAQAARYEITGRQVLAGEDA